MSLDWREMQGLQPNALQNALLEELERVMAGASAAQEDERLADLARREIRERGRSRG